jgi:4-hydroxy-3-methylbut-2-enyl diphosphate reductase IspH
MTYQSPAEAVVAIMLRSMESDAEASRAQIAAYEQAIAVINEIAKASRTSMSVHDSEQIGEALKYFADRIEDEKEYIEAICNETQEPPTCVSH